MVHAQLIGGWNADSDSSENNLDGTQPDPNLFGLVHIKNEAGNGYMGMGPIDEVFAVPANSYPDVSVQENRLRSHADRYKKLKPLWLKATIRKHHINQGEGTWKSKDLSAVIRARGKRTANNELTDECGHIIARSLGGNMIDINLYPQNKALNGGNKGQYLLWKCWEFLMKYWVKWIPEKYNPRVIFIMKLYEDQEYVDRPNKFFYDVHFLADEDDDSEDDDENDQISITQVVANCIQTIFECRAKELKSLKEIVKKKVDSFRSKCKKNLDQLLKELFSIIEKIKLKFEYQPTHVSLTEQSPEGRTYFDWNDETIKKWLEDAIKMQDAHVRDNNRTEFFAYHAADRDALELRLLMAMYGVRSPQEGSKGAPSCPMQTYSREERLHARKIKKKIIEHSTTPENIHLNVIYISTATKVENGTTFGFSEEPVFVINDHRKFIDKNGRVYVDFEDYKANNTLPKSATLAPKNGTYTPAVTNNGYVPLELGETPATGILSRIKAITDTAVMIGGIVLSVTGVVTFFSPALFSATAASVIQAGSFFVMTYGLVGAAHGINEKTAHDESISTEVFILISAALSNYSGMLRAQAIKYAREGKTFAEVMEKIGKVRSAMFTIANTLTIFSSSAALLSGIFNLLTKRERTWLDYYQLCMSTFMLCNVLTKPMTLKSVFESEQMQHLKQIKSNLQSEEAKEEMTNMQKEHSTSDQKAYLIRNLNKIENPTEFFELIRKTESVVTCTADGMAVDGNIDITPETYNHIGKTVFAEQLNKIDASREDIFRESVKEEFEKYIQEENRNEFRTELEKIKKLPAEQQQAATKNLVQRLGSQDDPLEEKFNSSWKNSQTAYETTMNEKINGVINRFQEGTVDPEQKKDFTELRDLAKKRIYGTMTNEERQQFKENFDKCSNHRKEHFFQSSSNHRDDTFRKDIETFTNSQNERLCYRINIDDVKKNLRDVFGVANHEDIKINGVKVFENMKPSDYHRLNRLLQDNGPNGPRLIAAIKTTVDDPNFNGNIRTTNDIFAMADDIKNKMNALPEDQRQTYLDSLSNGTSSTENSNTTTELVNAPRSEPVGLGLPGAFDDSRFETTNPGLPDASAECNSDPPVSHQHTTHTENAETYPDPGVEEAYTVRINQTETEYSTEPATKPFDFRRFVGLLLDLSAISHGGGGSGIKPYENCTNMGRLF